MMCSHYQMLKDRDRMEKYFRAHGMPLPPKWDMYPRKPGVFLRGENREIVVGRWGLIPAQTRPDYLPKAEKLPTSNARAETASKLYSFRNAWAKGQRCIVPAEAIYEPDWRTGKAVPTRFTRANGAPMGIAGLWDRYQDNTGQWQDSYTMLTINADGHPLFKHYHRPDKEKRMVVILPDEDYEGWLAGAPADSLLTGFPAESLATETPAQD
ncbi:SOS response-associated peptidase family protein [Pusillimonas sp. SM2304]|uniref:SOS response-associated peptidase n=1 Tax=Pusillimonas sp. SM2304 TaxID=3073241 RepID=UPI0028762B04|nr:SOS response-associated peptidase family protein [Pusillimonas sp. SM2304]MDS1141697.1 SOS response-associated peptidase family protein [Pusillimonas sp. SM2304]